MLSMIYIVYALMNDDRLPWSTEAEGQGMLEDSNFEKEFIKLRVANDDRYNLEIKHKLPS